MLGRGSLIIKLDLQSKGLSKAAMLAAAQALRHVCQNASPEYLTSAGLARATAAAVMACLEAAGAFAVSGTDHEAATRAALEAAGFLLRSAEKGVAESIRPGMIIKGVGVLKRAAQGAH